MLEFEGIRIPTLFKGVKDSFNWVLSKTPLILVESRTPLIW